MSYLELSSKTGVNIAECFQSLGKSLESTKDTVESIKSKGSGIRTLNNEDNEMTK